jgi:cytochrome c-type biogenesis protein CcmH/NrfG
MESPSSGASQSPPSAPPAPRLSLSEEHKVQALTAFALAEAALARNDMNTAEAHAARAVAGDPGRTEYVAFHAWVRAQSGVAKDVPEAIRTLNKILEEDPCDERALFYRGKLLRRNGQNKAALRDFVTILYTNPTHKEALAEVRVLRMRSKKS